QVVHQLCPVIRSSLRRPQRVQLQGDDVINAQLLPQAGSEQNQLCIDVRSSQTKYFQAHLVELPETAFLGFFVAEHGTQVPEFLHLVVKQTVLLAGSHTTGGSFRPQGDAATLFAQVGKGVHLLFDDVRDLADGTFEELSAFQQRKADLPITVTTNYIGDSGFQI